jgi:hypothetical protein
MRFGAIPLDDFSLSPVAELEAAYHQLDQWLVLIPTDEARLALGNLRLAHPALFVTPLDRVQATFRSAYLPVEDYFNSHGNPTQRAMLTQAKLFVESLFNADQFAHRNEASSL